MNLNIKRRPCSDGAWDCGWSELWLAGNSWRTGQRCIFDQAVVATGDDSIRHFSRCGGNPSKPKGIIDRPTIMRDRDVALMLPSAFAQAEYEKWSNFLTDQHLGNAIGGQIH